MSEDRRRSAKSGETRSISFDLIRSPAISRDLRSTSGALIRTKFDRIDPPRGNAEPSPGYRRNFGARAIDT